VLDTDDVVVEQALIAHRIEMAHCNVLTAVMVVMTGLAHENCGLVVLVDFSSWRKLRIRPPETKRL
jgi:hypothetical protein